MSVDVALSTAAPAALQLGAHASIPVGHVPETQSWAAPVPEMPSQAHAQQPQSVGALHAEPGAFDPG